MAPGRVACRNSECFHKFLYAWYVSPAVTHVGAGNRIAGRYLVVSHRGGGSDGDVYHVIDEYLGNEVALKLLAPKSGQPATWDEAQILEQIRSEYLLPVLMPTSSRAVTCGI